MRLTLSIAASIACLALPAKTHEFWIDPVDFQVETGGKVIANLRVGTGFEGTSQSYIPQNFVRFQYAQNGKAHEVQGVVGDRPAMNMEAKEEGLMVVIHQTDNLAVTWETWEKFKTFVTHKDADWVIDEHLAKGLEQDGVREIYSRYAKSLVAVGAGEGKDVVAGMLTEIVALENPYTGNMSDGFNVGVLYQGKPRSATQVEVFELDRSGELRVFTVKTNAKGVVTVPVKAGHKYMLDSVVLRRTDKKPVNGKPFVWESLWANMTFEVPSTGVGF